MNIIELAKEAAKDYNQELWDAHLLRWWSDYGNGAIRKCVGAFMSTNHVSVEQFNELKRVPRHERHWRCCVSRFIAAYLPKISEALFNGNLTKEQIIAAAKRMKIDTGNDPIDSSKAYRDRKEMDKSEREANAYSALKRIRANARLATSKSNWKTCK